MLYIEAPCGVGFSYSDTPSDYNTNDAKTAADNYAFIQGFLQLYPEFQSNDLWITGESYGGVYVPMLTDLVVNGDPQIRKQLKGIMAGNGVLNCDMDYNAVQFDLFYWHGLVSFMNYANWTKRGCDRDSSRSGCNYILNLTMSEIGVIDQQLKQENLQFVRSADKLDGQPQQASLDPDDLYQDFCLGNGTLFFTEVDPHGCTQPLGDRTLAYLNRPDVQRAIHARPAVWAPCVGFPPLNYTTSGMSMLPYYREFFALRPQIRILIYNGDVDIATVPFALNQFCMGQLFEEGLVYVEPWAHWFLNGATAGYVEYFDKYVFATVKGAGHETPQYQPLSAFNMFKRFITTGNLNVPSDEMEAEAQKVLMSSKARQQRAGMALRQGDMLRMQRLGSLGHH
jgi:serine carboxypeptidase-like clade 2